MMNYHAIAIDGPSGAGKSTVAKELSAQLKFIYIDTGAMYRAIGLYTAKAGVAANDREKVPALLSQIHLELGFIDGTQHIFLNGEDVSSQIRTEEASKRASDVSAIPEVRAFLLDFQRSFAQTNNVIMDGRDIGTVVLPNADLKIFLTATPEARAQRRYAEQIAKGMDVTYEQVLEGMRVRDLQDSTRAAAPLKPADDAVFVDSTDMNLQQTIDHIRAIAKERIGV